MPRTVLPTIPLIHQESVNIATSLVDVVNGNMFLNTGTCILYVANPAGAECDVDIYAVPDEALRTGTAAFIDGYKTTLPVSISGYFGPFTQAWWNQRLNNIGYIYVDFSRNTSCAVVIQM